MAETAARLRGCLKPSTSSKCAADQVIWLPRCTCQPHCPHEHGHSQVRRVIAMQTETRIVSLRNTKFVSMDQLTNITASATDLKNLLSDLQSTTAALKKTHLQSTGNLQQPLTNGHNRSSTSSHEADKEPDYADQEVRVNGQTNGTVKCDTSEASCSSSSSAQMAAVRSVHGTGLEDLEQLLDDYDHRRSGTLQSQHNVNGSLYRSTGSLQQQQGRPTVESLLGELDTANGHHHQQQQQQQYRHSQYSQQHSPQPTHFTDSYHSSGSGRPPSRGQQTAVSTLEQLLGSLTNDAPVKKKVDERGELQYTWSKKATSTPDERLNTLQRRGKSPAPASASMNAGELDSMLGTLQSDMSKHGINTIPKGECAACQKAIVGQVVIALGRMWHPEHFTCVVCGEELGHRNFFERGNKAYCENDYHNQFSPRCAYCNGAIKDKCVTALDKTWHVDHFFCAHCGKDFGDEGFHEKDGKAYCRTDFFSMFAPRCRGCKRAIQNNFITALNTQWHPECFVCQECSKPFAGGSFFEHDGVPFCEQHYHARRGTLCFECHKPISGRCVTAMEHKYHPEHFVCSFCRRELNKGTFKEHTNKPYCHKCFAKLL